MDHRLMAVLLFCLPAAEAQLVVATGGPGLAKLDYGGASFVADGAFRVWGAAFQTWDGERKPADLGGEKRGWDGDRLTLTYAWGEVRCRYHPEPDRLRLTIEVENRSDIPLTELALSPLEMRFPQPPRGWTEHMPYREFNLGGPTVNLADCAAGLVAVCNEDIGRPLQVGWAGRQSVTQRPVIVATTSDWMGEMLNPMLARPIYRGQTDRFELTIRFAPPGTRVEQLCGDLYQRFAAAHPYRLSWPDRRPIGALFPSSAGINGEHNPRGWFNDKGADFVSDEGRKQFRERLLAWGRQSVEVVKGFGGQGMITWDIEGQEYPHAISYLGDPRSLPPEMEPVADEYFRLFADAGLRTGICIRPQLPVRRSYRDGVRQIEVPDILANLDAKLTYAQKRWGCTLFYVDSNGDPNIPLPAAIFHALAARHPDVLLIPEHENAAYYACTMPYRDYANLKQLGTPDYVRRVYPRAASFVYVGHGDPAAVREQLVAAVRQGDILVVHGWYASPSQTVVKEIYAEAAKPGGQAE
ncbi:MAG: hypothetical protein HYU66_12215 [Armatimonadetes bacterium]|nr:hypothetical protein [Armatimonadota bacterium]